MKKARIGSSKAEKPEPVVEKTAPVKEKKKVKAAAIAVPEPVVEAVAVAPLKAKKVKADAPQDAPVEKKASKKRTAAPEATKPASVILSNKPTPEIIARACEALLHHVREHRKANEAKRTGKNALPGVSKEESTIFLQVGLRRVPEAAIKTFKGHAVSLPHNFRAANVEENVCLFVKDKAEARKALGEDYSNQYGVKKMIDLAQLRTRYKSFQSKRELASEYDCFLADDRIACMLPKALGKAFYVGSGKRPLPIRFGVANIKDTLRAKVNKALQSTYLYLSGVSTVLKVGHENMSEKDLVENIAACINGAVEHIPGKWKGVQSLFIKSEKSASLPLYEHLETGNAE